MALSQQQRAGQRGSRLIGKQAGDTDGILLPHTILGVVDEGQHANGIIIAIQQRHRHHSAEGNILPYPRRQLPRAVITNQLRLA